MPFLPIRYSVARSSNEPFKWILTRQRCTTTDKTEINDLPKFAYRLLFARRYTPLQKYASYLYTLIYLKVRSRKTDSQDCIKFANENPVCYIATMDGDQPRVRGFLMWFADEKGFYFQKRLQQEDQKTLY